MFTAVILGGGSGERMGLGYNKVLYKIKGKTIIEYASQHFIEDPDFKEVIIVANREDYDRIKVLFNYDKVRVIKGGETRQESVLQGLINMGQTVYVMIHDGARPNLSTNSIDKLKKQAVNGPATLYTKAKDSTVIYKDNQIKKYLKREQVANIKTPQVFLSKDIKKACLLAKENQHLYNDDASLYMGELGLKIILIEDDDVNIKLTTQFDLDIMEEIL